jgi:hypothetical protein
MTTLDEVLSHMMTYRTQDEIEGLVKEFENATLSRCEWTHTAHLTIALWYSLKHAHPENGELIRYGIQNYNAAQGIESTPTSGYHETITLFWIIIAQKFISSVDTHDALLILTSLFIDQYSNPKLVFDYYSYDVLFSAKARAQWIEPNLKFLTSSHERFL